MGEPWEINVELRMDLAAAEALRAMLPYREWAEPLADALEQSIAQHKKTGAGSRALVLMTKEA